MSIATEITRIQQAKADIKTAIEAKGVTVPSSATIDTYDDYVSQISGGGGVEPTYRWANSGETYCDNNGDIQQLQVRELSVDSGTTWYTNTGITQEQLVAFQNCDCINNLKTDLSGTTLTVNANAQNYAFTFYGIPASGNCNTSYVEFYSNDSWITADITQKQYPNSSGTVVVHIAANETGSQRNGHFQLHTYGWGQAINVAIIQTGTGGGGLESIPYGTDMSQYYNRYIKRIVIGDATISDDDCIINNWGQVSTGYITVARWGVYCGGDFSGISSLPIDATPTNPVQLLSWSYGNSTTNPFNYLQIEWQ